MDHFDTVIFDLDGTLLNTLDDLADSTNYALTVLGMPTRTLDEIRIFVGNGVARLVECAVPEQATKAQTAECLALFKAHYMTNMRNKTAPYPGILALLETLREKRYHMAVVSNKFDGAVKELCGVYFGALLPVAVGERPGLAKKPAPDLVWDCLTELGADAGRAVYVGDSEVDILTAKNAGLPCLSVSWGFRDENFLKANGAGQIAGTVAELLEML